MLRKLVSIKVSLSILLFIQLIFISGIRDLSAKDKL